MTQRVTLTLAAELADPIECLRYAATGEGTDRALSPEERTGERRRWWLNNLGVLGDDLPAVARIVARSRQCWARSKRSGRRCTQPAMRERMVCRFHGGKTERGQSTRRRNETRQSATLELDARIIARRIIADRGALDARQYDALVTEAARYTLGKIGRKAFRHAVDLLYRGDTAAP